MSDVKCARMMHGAAERDLLTLRSMTASAPDESVGFHVQQAAEKALKAWLALLDERYPLTHNIETLMNLLAEKGADTEAFRGLIDYTPYAVEFRYTGIDPDSNPIERDAALTLVESLLGEVGARLAGAETE